MTKADKKDEERKEQLETEALMDAEVEAATDCGPVSHKAEKKDKEKERGKRIIRNIFPSFEVTTWLTNILKS